VNIYWQHNLYIHFKCWSVCITFRPLPFSEWMEWHGTRYRPYREAETWRFGPLMVEWFNRCKPWGPGQ